MSSRTECHLLGRFLEIVKKDSSQAADVYKSNCLAGQDGESCYQLGQLYHSEKAMVDHGEAFAFNRRGCELGNAKCCLDAGLANLSDNLDEGCVGKDLSLAFQYVQRSCQLGSGFACHLLAGVYVTGIPGIVERDLSAAFRHDFEACKQLNFPPACASLRATLNVTTKATLDPSSGV